MNRSSPEESTADAQVSPVAAAALASLAFAVPLGLSASSSPTPNHPKPFLWYLTLREPAFKPPDWVFPVAWTGIEGALAVAGYRLLRASSSAARNKALGLLGWNIFMIGGWSRLFFKKRNLAASTVAAASMIATGVALTNAAKPVDRIAARATLPLLGWVTFATVLTATIWSMNSGRRR